MMMNALLVEKVLANLHTAAALHIIMPLGASTSIHFVIAINVLI
jgi:hypothetical protein